MRVCHIALEACEWPCVGTPQTIDGGLMPDPPSTIKEGRIALDDERKLSHGVPREDDTSRSSDRD
jgi:hypothetical protein